MRLTKKRTDGLYEPTNELYGQENGIRLAQKLGQYEEIEQEFEIDNFEDLRERLKTYKFLANHEMSCVDVEGYNCMLKDLKKYHDIEDTCDIDLTTFKVLNTNTNELSLIAFCDKEHKHEFVFKLSKVHTF